MSLDVYLVDNLCPHCKRRDDIWEANITHNLTAMADEAGIYKLVWRPDEVGIKKAGELVEPLTKAIDEMEADPERFKKHNPPNGWGSYSGFLHWVIQYRDACKRFPDADIEVSR